MYSCLTWMSGCTITRVNTCVSGDFWLLHCVFNLSLCAQAKYITALQLRRRRICHPSSFLWQRHEWVDRSGFVAVGHPPAPVPHLCLFSLPPSFLWTCFYCCLFFSFVYLVTWARDSGGALGKIYATVLTKNNFFLSFNCNCSLVNDNFISFFHQMRVLSENKKMLSFTSHTASNICDVLNPCFLK